MKNLALWMLLAAASPLFQSSQASAQQTPDKLFPAARVEQKTIYTLDPARTVKIFDATPDARHWFAVDAFAAWQRITVDGHPIATQYHEIPLSGTRLSPNGEYLIWTGLMHGYTQHGFDSTITTVYRDTTALGSFVSDYPAIEFSRTGNRWAVMLPYAYQQQTGDRDFVMVDGTVASKNEVYPHLFSFSHDENSWAYRATDGQDEKLVTSDHKTVLLYKRALPSNGVRWDPTIWRYTPDVSIRHEQLEGRDYDMNFEHIARQYRTAYSSLSADTARTYINYAGHNQPLFRWINSLIIDTAGKHIAYFACDPAQTRKDTNVDERRAVVVYDGKTVAGPFPGVARLFLSPSGKHYAYSVSGAAPGFYLDNKKIAKTGQIFDCIWSPDESQVAFVASGEHGKLFVVADGRRSPLFEALGRIGWTDNGKEVQFVGLTNSRVIKVEQRP